MISKLIEKLKSSKKRRELFVEGQIKTGIHFQVRALRDKMGWTQSQLGAQLGMTQTNVSRLESPGYGRLNITTLQRIASVFDVALIVRFVSFSELAKWVQNLSPDVMAPQSFDEESDEDFIMPTRYQGSFAQATYLTPSSSFAIDIAGRSENFNKELRRKMGLSSIDEEASGALRTLIGGLGNIQSYALGQVSKGNVLEFNYSYATSN
jgi:transcriptional regulator with XRE-family HTH domain